MIVLPNAVFAFRLMPHEAVYKVSLQRATANNPLVNLSGTVTLKINKDCNHWITNLDSDAYFYYRDGHVSHHETINSTRENTKNHEFQFAIREMINGHLEKFERGHAKQNKINLATEIITNDTKLINKYDGQHMFPIQHSLALFDQIESKEKEKLYYLYDGLVDINGERLNTIHVFVGDEYMKGEKRHWPVSFAYYNIDQTSMLPLHEMHFKMSGDGIIDDISFVYDDFTVQQSLINVKKLEIKRCD